MNPSAPNTKTSSRSHWLSILLNLGLLALGLYFAFAHFWRSGLDAISGDAIDARFNAMVLEHTWLWLTGVHASLFDSPMFYPHANAYAYSDYLFGTAPLYWAIRAAGLDILLSFQAWIIAGCVANYLVFFALMRRGFGVSTALAALGAYMFAFALPRIAHAEHAQLVPQYYVVLSAIGALAWWRAPRSKSGPLLFFVGGALQLLTAYYYLWFWVWTLAVFAGYVASQPARRQAAREWFSAIDRRYTGAVLVGTIILAWPFLYHYALAAREFGAFRDWVSVSDGAPRLISWLYLPTDHWQWPLVPMKFWIEKLPIRHEHTLSFGLSTWAILFLACRWIRRTEYRYLLAPIVLMFLLTISIGRFTTWGFMTFLFPGGGAIRVPNRIHIFMLLVWSPVLILYLQSLWNSGRRKALVFAWIAVACFFAENLYTPPAKLSRAGDSARMSALTARLPSDCRILVYADGLRDWIDLPNIDAVVAAFTTGRASVNGYSGNRPNGYRDTLFNLDPNAGRDHPRELREKRLPEWFRSHGVPEPRLCFLDPPSGT